MTAESAVAAAEERLDVTTSNYKKQLQQRLGLEAALEQTVAEVSIKQHLLLLLLLVIFLVQQVSRKRNIVIDPAAVHPLSSTSGNVCRPQSLTTWKGTKWRRRNSRRCSRI